MTKRSWCLVVSTVLLLRAGGAGADANVLDPAQLATVDPGAAPGSEEVFTLAEQWTLECGDDPRFMLGVVNEAAATREGAILLVDRPLGHVLMVGADGACLGVRGRTGDGPGELRALFCAAGLDDGRIVLSEGMPPFVFGTGAGKVVILDGEGLPVGGFDLQDPALGNVFPTLRGLRARGERLLVGLQSTVVRPPQMTSINRLLLTGLDGATVAVLGDRRIESSFLDTELREADVFEPYTLDRFDLAGDGRVAFAPERDAYLVVIVDPATGEGLRVVREIAGRRRTEAERESLAEANGGAGVDYIACESDPVIRGLRFRPDGCLWVALGRDEAAPADEFGTFDEIGPDGAWRRRIRLRAPGDAGDDRLIMLQDGRFVRVAGVADAGLGDEGISVQLLAK